MAAPNVTLRPALISDYPLIEAWLRLSEVQRWWGSLSVAQAAVIAALQAPMGLCSIILADDIPAGYIQAQEDGSPECAGAYRVDAFVGERRYRSSGVGRRALELAAEEIFQSTLVPEIVALIPVRVEPAVRLYERAGFKWARVVDDPLLGPCWLMRRVRNV